MNGIKKVQISTNNKSEIYPKISIITVVYNGAKTIEQTIESVVNQTYKNIEYIIIDGGSTDGTVDIIKKYEEKVVYWVSEPDKGIYDAMNKGAKFCTGDYVYFLGCDDNFIDYGIISKIADYFKNNKEIDVFCGSVFGIDEENKFQKKYTSSILDDFSGIPHQGMFVKNNYIKKYEFNTKYKILADYEFVIRCKKDRNVIFGYLDMAIAFYSLSGFSSKFKQQAEKEHIDIMKKYGATKRHIDGYIKEIKFSFYLIRPIMSFLKLISLSDFIKLKFGWKKHKCDLKICRWCNRI